MGVLMLDITYTFIGTELHDNHNCARLDYTGDITSKPSDNPAMKTSIEQGKMAGTIWFDPELGMLLDNQSHQDMNMTIVANKQTITSVLSQEVSLKLASVADLGK